MKKDKDGVRKELEGLSPLLHRLKKGHPDMPSDQLPKGYFHRMQDKVMGQLREEERQHRSSKSSVFQWGEWLNQLFSPRLVASLATVLVLVVAGLWWMNHSDDIHAGEGDIVWSSLSQSEVDAYVNENLDDFDLDLIVRYTEDASSSLDLFLPEQMEEEELDQYLDEIIDDLEIEDLL
jgi:hypothetical protein